MIFLDTDAGLKGIPEIFKEYFGVLRYDRGRKVYHALNTACGPGAPSSSNARGSVPSLQAYFRINTESMGQFERMIIADEEALRTPVERLYRPSTNPTPTLGHRKSL